VLTKVFVYKNIKNHVALYSRSLGRLQRQYAWALCWWSYPPTLPIVYSRQMGTRSFFFRVYI